MTKHILLTLLNCSWQWGLLGGLTWLITRRFRHTNSTSHVLWLLFLLSLPILFILNQFVPAISINTTVPELTQTQVQPVHIPSLAAQDVLIPETVAVPTEIYTQSQGHTVTNTVTKSQFSFNWTMTDVLLCIWAIGTLVMLVRVAFGLYRIHRLRRSATVADSAYQATCQRLAQQLNINRSVTVYFSDRLISPISFGWLSPSILIPRKLNLEQFELVAAHELAHVQRLDWLTNLFSHVVGAIFFFHPIYHFLNRKLVHLRERICDDWVIQLTGARKNYAQCLLDMVHHKEQSIPLTLGLNEPSELESRINAILKNNRQLDLQPRRRLLVVAVTLLLTCLPLLAMAQLVPLKTVQLSLFAQTPQESEKVEKKRGEQKKPAEMKDKKEYKDDKSIKVLDPAGFNTSEDRVFSGPQPGEKLPPLKVTGITGKFDGKEFDIVKASGEKPLLLFMQDDSVVGLKGLYLFADTIAPIMDKVDEQLHTAVVFLSDNLTETSKLVDELDKFSKSFQLGISRDGREGPGVYGLNRNVAQTIIIAKDGKVLHNFAFTQPMLYTDPHLLGAIAQAIEIQPATLEKWLNQEMAKKSKEDVKRYKRKVTEANTKLVALKFSILHLKVKSGKISKEEAAEQLKKLGITWEEDEALLKKEQDSDKTMDKYEIGPLLDKLREDLESLKEDLDTIMNGRLLKKEADTFQKMDKYDIGPLLDKLLNPKIPTLEIKNPAEGEDTGKMLLKGTFVIDGNVVHLDETVVKFDELRTLLRNLPEEQKSMFIIQAERDVLHEQITKVMDIAKHAGIEKIGFGISENVKIPTLEIKNPAEGEDTGKMLLKGTFILDGNVVHLDGTVVQFDELRTLLRNLPEEQKSLLSIQSEENVPHEQIVKILNITKKAGIKEFIFPRIEEILNMEKDKEGDPSPEERIRRDGDPKASPEGRRMEREGERESERTPSAEELVKQSDKDGDGNQENVTIPDANLAAVVREALGLDPNAPIPKKKLEALEILYAFQKDIGDLTGLENATGLKTLIIRGAHKQKKVRDITPLAGLTQLTKLSLSENRIEDIKPLAGLTQLKDLSLNNNELIDDITPLSGLKHLIHLSLWNNLIRDITPLAELTQLESLRIFMNEISDITPIANLKQLIHLDISINRIRDITPIADLKQLTELRLQANRIDYITPIANLKQLTDLTLNRNRISDITPLSGLRQLTELSITHNRISDITPLSGLRQLTELSITHNQIRDFRPLNKLTQLTVIELSNNPIKIRDMEPLRLLLKQQPDLKIDITIPSDEEGSRYRKNHIEVKNPDEFKKGQEKVVFSGPQPGEKLLPLKATAINGEAKGETFDFIAKADGEVLVLFLQDETPLGLRGLVGVSRLFGQIAEKSKQTMQMHAVFLPDTLENQASRIGYYQRELVPYIPSDVLLGISQDGREGPGSYGLNRSVAQTVIIAKDGKVLHNFAFTQPMPWPDPHVLGAIGEAIGVQPATLEKWLNETYPVIPTWWNIKNPVIQIKNPAEGEKTGKMLLSGTFVRDGKNREIGHLRGTVVQFDKLRTLLRNYPDEHKSTLMLIIQADRDVPHEQVVKVMDIAKEAGMEKIGFAIDSAEDKSMESDEAEEHRSKDSD